MRADLADVIARWNQVHPKEGKALSRARALIPVVEQRLRSTDNVLWLQQVTQTLDPDNWNASNIYSGFLILTDEDLVFIGLRAVGRWPYHAISAISSAPGRIKNVRINISTASERLYFFSTPRVPVTGFMGILTKKIDNAEAANHAPSAISIADEVARFAQLRDAGVLTEDEFNRKKAQLLSL